MRNLTPTKGDIVFVVEIDNTFIGVITGKTMVYEGVIEIEPMYFKRKVNTTSMWTQPNNVKAILGNNKKKALIEYAEYFV